MRSTYYPGVCTKPGTYYQGWFMYMRYTQGQNEEYVLRIRKLYKFPCTSSSENAHNTWPKVVAHSLSNLYFVDVFYFSQCLVFPLQGCRCRVHLLQTLNNNNNNNNNSKHHSPKDSNVVQVSTSGEQMTFKMK